MCFNFYTGKRATLIHAPQLIKSCCIINQYELLLLSSLSSSSNFSLLSFGWEIFTYPGI